MDLSSWWWVRWEVEKAMPEVVARICTGKAQAHAHIPPSTQSSGAHKEVSSADLLCQSLGTTGPFVLFVAFCSC